LNNANQQEQFDLTKFVLPKEFWQNRLAATDNNGQPTPKPQDLASVLAHGTTQAGKTKERKPKGVKPLKFYLLPQPIFDNLVLQNTSGSVFGTLAALYEAWFRSGIADDHLNPFPLAQCDFESRRITRLQKHRALKRLVETGWISVDRSDAKKPLVTLTWKRLFTP
jgi:hypothetical protein